MMMAQKSGAWLVPVGVSASRRKLIKTWDSYMVPGFFSKAIMIFGEPVRLAERMTPEAMEKARRELQDRMNELEVEAERRMGHVA